jgi:hypothetical protein
MKKNLLIVFIIVTTTARLFSQDFLRHFPMVDGDIVYQDIVKVDSSLSVDELYLKTKEWFIKTFVSANDVIQSDNPELGFIIGKGYIEKGFAKLGTSNPKNWFVLKIELKKGRYRYTLYEIIYEYTFSFEGMSDQIKHNLETYLKPQGKVSKRRAAKIDKYCIELNEEFKNILKSLEISLTETNEEW